MVGALTTTKRFNQLNSRLREIHQRYGRYTIVPCGHSLAGELSRQLLLKNSNIVSAAYVFNSGSGLGVAADALKCRLKMSSACKIMN
jgi:hypothetical protein